MESMEKIPNAEFKIMKAVWASTPPVTTKMVKSLLSEDRNWQSTTIITLMTRLVKRGFLRSERKGLARTFYPLVTRDEYLRFATKQFVEQYHEDSFGNLIQAFTKGHKRELKKIQKSIDKILEKK
ncbi:MAG: BlaI/MecI/CopY family transcriptional regulator [Thermoguttaceae bacterium]|nr:BlaI/MecI/CopY family transcriptional regulator [Thermoguttaceae bacterium]